ncbi:hypothetical protein GR160_11060 [Flavobacterium sp. Sd200]|uniref:hypothetical protein n=1 Tax=Flavobacterium sp. Sd200 TaxID=2692211 RepID=UPI00136EAF38|nr:hypothetical protein [Flavobacterium sp. Sd200]MXN91764.1 hypothetical protein [Flavobacterium sp. Sd200]
MARIYIAVFLVLFVCGFAALGLKRLLLLRAGYGSQKRSVNWFMVALFILMAIAMLSCNSKTQEEDAVTEQDPVIVTSTEEKSSTVHKVVDGKGNVTATVTISVKGDNGEIVTEEKVFKGTRAEVDAQIKAL